MDVQLKNSKESESQSSEESTQLTNVYYQFPPPKISQIAAGARCTSQSSENLQLTTDASSYFLNPQKRQMFEGAWTHFLGSDDPRLAADGWSNFQSSDKPANGVRHQPHHPEESKQATQNQQNTYMDPMQYNVCQLEIASHCTDYYCQIPSCYNMKKDVAHAYMCKPNFEGSIFKGACGTCKQLVALSCYHAETCNKFLCPVPFCDLIKEDQLRLQHWHHLLQQIQELWTSMDGKLIK